MASNESALQQFIDAAASAAVKVESAAKAIAANPITAELEKLVPSLTGLVLKWEGYAITLGTIGAAVPELEMAYGLYKLLGGQPNQDLDHVGPGRNEPGSGGSSGGT